MAGMVVHWPRPQDAVLLVIVTAIQPQLFNATAAIVGVKPTSRQHGPYGLDAVLNPQVRGDTNSAQAATGETQAFQDLGAGYASPQFTGLRVMR